MSGRKEAARSDLATLLVQVAEGDRAALRSIYVRQSNRLFGLAVAILRDRITAADALQSGFVAIWRDARRFDPARETAEGWMAGIIRHAALDGARHRGRERPLDPGFDDCGVDPEGGLEILQATVAGQRLRGALLGLEPERRRALVLAHVHGLSLPELAARLDRPIGQTILAVRHGLAALREALP